MFLFLIKGFKLIVALFATCPECNSSNVDEDVSYGGYTKYSCNDCNHSWTE